MEQETKFYLIGAMDRNRIVGKENKMPWHLPAELAYFKKVTMGHVVIMGRKTFQSIGKPLPGRKNIVLSRDSNFDAPGCTIVHSVEEALQECANESAVFVIGGAQIYRTFLPLASRIYITIIDHAFEGDETFPIWDELEWKEVSRQAREADEKNKYPFSFHVLERHEETR